ncbi:MAG: RdgB/HAM1 family non-canonical purine NTP pyrophosphatase [Burkholderiales bacterium]|nr:RdgB/HAM1 family non-canonical purine NTP pyrophosphatase [Burkholderiales bacterium]
MVIASGNRGKLKEIARILEPLEFEVMAQSEFGVPEADEPHRTFVENALEKARNASFHTGLPALADDSGICVEHLSGEPGIHSARFSGEPKSDQRNNEKLLEMLQGVSDRRAHYYCVIVFLRHPEDPEPLIAEGRWRGVLLDEYRGSGGFGYDPLFYVPEYAMTAAELPVETKNRVSHRAQAMAGIMEKLKWG